MRLSKISLRTRAIFSIILILVISISFFVGITVSSHHKMTEELMISNYINFSKVLAITAQDALISGDKDLLARQLNNVITGPDIIHINITDSGDRVFFSTPLSPEKIEKIELLPQIGGNGERKKLIRKSGEFSVYELGSPGGFFHEKGHLFQISTELVSSGRPIGKAELTISTKSMNKELARTNWWGLKFVAVTVFLGAGFIFLVDRKLKKILTNLIQTTRKMTTGDLSQKVEIRTGDDLEELGNSFNIMAKAIHDREEQLTKHKLILERLATTGEMAAILAHEMRNSLTSIKMILQLQMESKNISTAELESLQVAVDSIYRLEKVVDDLLKFAKPAPPEFSPGSVNELIKEAVELSRHQLSKTGVKLRLFLNPDLPDIKLDPLHFKEVMVNLIINAIHASKKEGVIEISTDKTVLNKTLIDFKLNGSTMSKGSVLDVPMEEIRLEKDSEAICIKVSDTGEGISGENLSRIFDPFFTTKLNGTGLGLSLVKRIVNTHGGIITVKSQLGKGTDFFIYLPVEVELN